MRLPKFSSKNSLKFSFMRHSGNTRRLHVFWEHAAVARCRSIFESTMRSRMVAWTAGLGMVGEAVWAVAETKHQLSWGMWSAPPLDEPPAHISFCILRDQIPALPKSKRGPEGRFVLDKRQFPDAEVESPGFSTIWKWRSTCPANPVMSLEEIQRELPVLIPSQEALAHPPADKMQVTWLGHASVLTQWDKWNVLFDPIFSERCSPTQLLGPRRLQAPPLLAHQLPHIDVICISHDHFDHLDLHTAQELAARRPSPIWLVPLGLKSWLQESRVHNVIELDWSDQIEIVDSSGVRREALKLSCLPCQHWCARNLFDRNKTLWASWMCSTPRFSFYFGGDTGYCPMFEKVGRALGSPDVAAIPIGSYGALPEVWFHRPNHMNPEEAVQCHLDLRARRSVAIHWGTWQLTAEHPLEPRQRLQDVCRDRGLGAEAFECLKHGETRCYDHR
jgi:N-acyl-phosphatidylethanolamine-hydrolysing phospholipase D